MEESVKDFLKEKIFSYIKEHPGTSFVEIENIDDKAKGDLAFTLKEFNIVIWDALSEECCVAIKELISEKKIQLDGGGCIMIYMIDGKRMTLPIAKKMMKYKKERWLPSVLNICGHHKKKKGKK